MNLDQKPVNICRLGISCLKLIKSDAEVKGIKLCYDCDVDNRLLILDKKLLRQVLSILLFNSLKYTNSGYISLILLIKDSHINIFLSDSGIGIEDSDVQRIFYPFSQNDAKIKTFQTGTGLNLYLCKMLVNNMKGEISVASVSGKFTSFLISLPCVYAGNAVSAGDGIMNKAHSSHILNSPLRKITALVVDDNVACAFVLGQLLQKINIDFDCFYNGEKAVEAVSKKVYDIIFMDINMPVMNGILATKLIRQYNKEHNRPKQVILAVTAQKESTTDNEMRSANFDGIFSKPMSIYLVKKVVEGYTNLANSL